jgi:phosphoglycolate phosphatase
MNKKDPKLIIFDFDNCISDLVDVGQEVVDTLSKKYLKNKINLKKVMYNEGMSGVIKKSKVKLWRVPFIIRRFRKELKRDFYKVKPHKGMLDLIKSLSKTHTLAILTSNSKENVELFLTKYKIKKYFTVIKTNSSLFTKSFHIRRIKRKLKFTKDNTFMVGDEVRDIRAANSAKIKSVAVTWGINSKKLLKKQNPSYVANTPEKLKKIF